MEAKFKIGDRIIVKESIKIYTHPQHKGQPFDIQGLEGEVVDILFTWQERPISPNYPYQVQLNPRLKVHLGEYEIAPIS